MSDTYTTNPQIASYIIGRQMGDQLAANPFEGVDAQAVAAGVIDTLEGKPTTIDEAKIAAAFEEIHKEMEAKKAAESKVAAAIGETFLVENANKDGVVVTESGLQYEIITEGKGDKPTAESTVSTHYHGTLVDGTVFDSSVERGQPAEFPVNRVIAGWTEALQMMPVGSKWRLFVPHDLAYGPQGSGGTIAPYSALIFEVELLEIVS
ncbi:MAG: FKBP-type peptidyl-prolyl cis-trans isomerase FklB [Thiomicrorhabdus sp.]|nr:MAG: FKBP-type peptidyl-prolyl cis-trans isomerase FklB [Thiomicrorhabdus sp.]